MFIMQKFSKISNNTGIRSRVNLGTRTGTPDRIYYNKEGHQIILSGVVIQLVPLGVLNTFALPNQASST